MESSTNIENNLSIQVSDGEDLNLQNDDKPDIHNNIEIQEDNIINGRRKRRREEEENVLIKKENDDKSIQTEDLYDDLHKFFMSDQFLSQTRTQCEGCKPLHIASALGRLDMVQKLIEKGEAVNVRNKNDQTPLHLAVRNNKLKVVQYLVEKNAFIDAQENGECYTPLHCAVLQNYPNIVEYLCSQKALTYIKNSRGKTPLTMASIIYDRDKCAEI